MPKSANQGEQRKDPELLLKRLKEETRGKLTVFLGAAAGVGKTYSMLQTARERLAEDVDVVAALIETHGRVETQALLEGIPAIPPKAIEYKGRMLTELDLDEVLNRRPALVLIDELAHTNVPGSRHARRYLDVQEVLNSGIDVYTTLNIQHLESLNDIIGKITQVTVRETVSDRFVESADQVELVDLPVEKLLERLREGKVYAPLQAEVAVRNFFRAGNLNALRELALHWMVEHVDKQLRNYMADHDIDGPWPARERILVAVSSNPMSTSLIRIARRMAASLSAPWIAAYIETPDQESENDGKVSTILRLAEELGAETLTMKSTSVSQGLLELARERNVTQIVMGKSLRPFWKEFMRGSFVDQVLKNSRGIAVHVIPDASSDAPAVLGSRLKLREVPFGKPDFARSLTVLIITALMTAVFTALRSVIDVVNLSLLYLIPVLSTSIIWGGVPAIIAAVAGVLCFDFFFIPPFFRFTVADTRYLFTFAVFLGIAIITSRLSSRLRHHIDAAKKRQSQMRVLHDISREIAAIDNLDRIADILARRTQEITQYPSVILLPDSEERLRIVAKSSEIDLARNEEGVAVWAFSHGESAGRGTQTLSGADSLCLPLKVDGAAIGVLAILPSSEFRAMPQEQKLLLENISDLAAIAIERAHLTREAERARWLTESERLYNTIFNSVSHELKTPLATIIGAVTSLLDESTVIDPDIERELLESIRDQGSQMNRLLSNLLNMARLESGKLSLALDWVDMVDLVSTTVDRMSVVLKGHRVLLSPADSLPLVKGDVMLLEQVMVNLLTNAARYSPDGIPIEIDVFSRSRLLFIRVSDKGPGVRACDLPNLFEKFSNLHEANGKRGGTGLGLSICKGIVEAHKGMIKAENRTGGGLSITFAIPVPLPPIPFDIGGIPTTEGA